MHIVILSSQNRGETKREKKEKKKHNGKNKLKTTGKHRKRKYDHKYLMLRPHLPSLISFRGETKREKTQWEKQTIDNGQT